MGKLYDKILAQYVKQLADEGERIILDAYNRKGFNNRTYNLHDSYGSAVYRNGVLLRHTIRFVGAPMEEYRDDAPNKQMGYYQGERTRALRGSSWSQHNKFNEGDRLEQGEALNLHGRDEVNAFFSNYKPKSKDGLELVVIAAMYYAGMVEKKYQVISNAVTGLERIARSFGKDSKVEGYKMEIWRNEGAIGSNAFTIKSEQKVI